MRRLGVSFEHKDYQHYRVHGKAHIDAFSFYVPADFSSAAFPLAAAILTRSTLTIPHLDPSDVQGDKILVNLLQTMGADLVYHQNALQITPTKSLKGMEIDLNTCIDALPILAVIGTQCEGKTILRNGAIARKKESDRISAIAHNLKRMGAHIEELPDGLIIHPSALQGAEVDSFHDHRIALSLSIAGMVATGRTRIHNSSCSAKSYPHYLALMQCAGAQIHYA